MSYSWDLPATPNAPAPMPSSSTSSASTRTVLAGLLDQEIDPATLDFIDTDDGGWSETPDSRSIVLCQIEIEIGKSYHTPGDGTEIRAKLETGEPLTTTGVEADVRRALSILEAAGILAAVQITGRDENGDQLVDETGRAAFLLHYIDLATGSPVDMVYRPTGG